MLPVPLTAAVLVQLRCYGVRCPCTRPVPQLWDTCYPAPPRPQPNCGCSMLLTTAPSAPPPPPPPRRAPLCLPLSLDGDLLRPEHTTTPATISTNLRHHHHCPTISPPLLAGCSAWSWGCAGGALATRPRPRWRRPGRCPSWPPCRCRARTASRTWGWRRCGGGGGGRLGAGGACLHVHTQLLFGMQPHMCMGVCCCRMTHWVVARGGTGLGGGEAGQPMPTA